MSELSREQVLQCLGKLFVTDRESLANHDVALRAKLEAMTEERNNLRSELSAWKKHGHSKEQQLAASEQRFRDAENERIEWVRRAEQAEWNATYWHNTHEAKFDTIHALRMQVAASEQRVKEVEVLNAGLRHANSVFTRNWDKLRDQLQATVTAQQEEIERLRSLALSIAPIEVFEGCNERVCLVCGVTCPDNGAPFTHSDGCAWHNLKIMTGTKEGV